LDTGLYASYRHGGGSVFDFFKIRNLACLTESTNAGNL
jgi:hypothetical protein